MKQIGLAGMQVVHAGTPQQIARAKQLLGDVRRGLYGILAEDDEEEE
jgi:hypothetical protein